jgi:DNA repair protein RadC
METNHQSSEQYPLNTALEEENQIIAEAKQLLYKRMTNRKYDRFTSPGAVRDYLRFHLAERKHEIFYCLFLDSQHRLLDDRELFRGTIDGCSVYPREVVKATLEVNAAAVILAHNHPSGIAEPSAADRQITDRLKSALALVDVRVLDHFVVGDQDVISFAERGWV